MESKKHLRKLLHLYQSYGGEIITTVQTTTTSSSSSSASPPSSLDSYMAFTIFVFLIALFFMAFFSVFIRHFAEDDSTAETSSSRTTTRRSSSTMSPRRHFTLRRRLDFQAVSLPVYRYTKTAAKHRIENCVICLSDFEEGETVKVIPHCGHVFHVYCVDTWLTSHVSCPFCRSTHVLPNQGSVGSSCRSTVEEHDTCFGVGPCLKRWSSCSSLEQRTGL